MHAEHRLSDTASLKLPEGLLADIRRHSKKSEPDFRVEGWKPSLFERLLAMLGLK
jgi:hypothetical protein